ncbi:MULTISPECIES: alkaline phosphatase D family protein [Flavobacteriaceae]|uniref:alkaline phosphatase D family protein n=1 Tax=Flavobacteriaceae TaxID=49546 RepID=UPI001492CDC0|nr:MULTISPECIES: PA14 domain-containing protein [Allomuricauda]MDC6367642.1 alkaline phosphatase D family protein [Muricauda sp. AC10]
MKNFVLAMGGCLAFLNVTQAQFRPKKEGDFRIAVLACIRQFEPAPAFANYVKADPDLCLWIGDNIYADADTEAQWIQTCYDTLAAKPHFSELRNDFDLMATWDDHDFGLNDAGKDYRFKKESKAFFRKFWGLEDVIPQKQDGIYYARDFEIGEKTMKIIMLDARYNRDDPDTDGDVLGEPQWQWLKSELQKSSDLTLIVSGFQILLDKDAGSETWDKFPTAKQRLFNTVREAQAENVLFLTGDQHYGEVCRTRNTMDFDAIELQFAGVNQIEGPEFNFNRVSPVIKSLNSIALIDVQMETTEEDIPHLLFRIANATTGEIELIYRVNLDEIALDLNFSEPTSFSENTKVTLQHRYPDLRVRYTTDGSEPTVRSLEYAKPLAIEETTTVKARFFTQDNRPRSKVFVQTYEKLEPIAAYAPKGKRPSKKGLTYTYYEGDFTKLPDFNALKRTKKGTVATVDLKEIPHREDHFAIKYRGFVDIPETDTYAFYLISDDGSKLHISGRDVVNNDGSHSKRFKKGLISLEKGLHPIEIEYFEDYGGQALKLGYVKENGTPVELSADMFFH